MTHKDLGGVGAERQVSERVVDDDVTQLEQTLVAVGALLAVQLVAVAVFDAARARSVLQTARARTVRRRERPCARSLFLHCEHACP